MAFRPTIRSAGTLVIVDCFSSRIDLAPAGLVREHDLPIRQSVHVGEFAEISIGIFDWDFVGPDDFAALDKEHRLVRLTRIPLAGIKKIVLRKTFAGESGL